jgi:hypothetical protein
MVLKNTERPVSVVHHHDAIYKPNRKGEWEIEDGHVAALRSHGLELKEEAELRARTVPVGESPEEEAKRLEARLAEIRKKK